MPLDSTYSADFERIWRAYPRWPKGRSVKRLAWDKWEKARKELEFTPEDVQAILDGIDERKRQHEYWQVGHRFGPPGLQKYIHQRLWNEEYPRAKRSRAMPERAEPETVEIDWEASARARDAAMRALGRPGY